MTRIREEEVCTSTQEVQFQLKLCRCKHTSALLKCRLMHHSYFPLWFCVIKGMIPFQLQMQQ